MTFGNKEQFSLMLKALEASAKIFREKLTLNVVVTKINFNSVNKILNLSKKKRVRVKLLEMTNGKQFPEIYVPFPLIVRSFKAKSIEYINSCCQADNCELCKRLYPVVRLSPDGKINGCIANEKGEKNILKAIKNRNENYIKKNLLSCLNNKRRLK